MSKNCIQHFEHKSWSIFLLGGVVETQQVLIFFSKKNEEKQKIVSFWSKQQSSCFENFDRDGYDWNFFLIEKEKKMERRMSIYKKNFNSCFQLGGVKLSKI